MKKYTQFIKESNKSSLKDSWFKSIIENDDDEVKNLIEDGIDIEMRNNKFQTELITIDNQTGLMIAAQLEYENILDILIKAGADINAKDKYGDTALMKATDYDQYNTMKILLDAGADINIKDENGYDFIDYCNKAIDNEYLLEDDDCFLKSYNFQNQLIKHEEMNLILKLNNLRMIDNRIKEENKELFKAAGWGLLEAVSKNYQKYKDADFDSLTDKQKEFLWFKAIECGDIETIKNMIDYGFDINIQDKFGRTALKISVVLKNKAIFDLLLNQPNIDINRKNRNGWNVVVLAHINKCTEMEKILLLRPDLDMTPEEYNNLFTFMNIKQNYRLIDYEFQNKLLNSGKEDIIFLFNKKGIVHPKIKEENPDLFKAADWGLI